MSRRKLFREADLARALKVTLAAGVGIGRVEIDPEGRIVIVSRVPLDDEAGGREAAKASLEALRERLRRERSEGSAPGKRQAH